MGQSTKRVVLQYDLDGCRSCKDVRNVVQILLTVDSYRDKARSLRISKQESVMLQKKGKPSLSQLKRFSGLDVDVLEVLREAIFDGAFLPGDRLNESHIANQLNISRGPVREALRRLEEMGLVIRSPGRGCFVKQYERRDIEELWTLRNVLEQFAISLACPVTTKKDLHRLLEIVNKMHHAAEEKDQKKLLDLDLKFHAYLLDLANHSLLKKTWQSLGIRIQRFLYLQPSIYDNLDKIAQTHEPIVSALEAGNVAKAQEAIEQHINEVAELSLSDKKDLARKEESS